MVLSTQISLPDDVLSRPRLLERLDLNLSYKVAILSAPPGYGKTTLAVQFARDVAVPVVWLTLEDRHRDVSVLHREALAGLQDVFPAISDLTCPDYASPADLATGITYTITTHLRQRLVWMLDDVHHLVDAPDSEAWLRALVKTLPRNCRLLLLSRTLPKLPLSDLIARRELVALSEEDLRFSPGEITQLLSHEPVEPTWDLIDRLDGWPAGIMLALYPLPLAVTQVTGDVAEPEALFRALATSLLDRQLPALRDFLLESSTLATLTPERCEQILHLPDAQHWLDEARQGHLFLTSTTGGLAYHQLFRDFLQREFKSQDRARFELLHQQAADWFMANELPDEAFAHCMAADLVACATTIVEQQAQPYFVQGRHETLLAWARRLRHSDCATPRLWYTCAMIHQDRYEYDEANVFLEAAKPVFEASQDQTGLVNVVLQEATIALYSGEYHEAAALAQTMLKQLVEPSGERSVMLNVMGLAHLQWGDLPQAVAYLEEALPLYRLYNDRHAVATLLQSLEVAYTRAGRLDEAEACIQEVIALRHDLGHPGALAMALNNLGYHYHLRGDYAQASRHFREGLNLVAASPDRRAEAYLMWSLGDLQRDRGGFAESRSLYEKALRLAVSHEVSLQCAILLSMSTLHRWQGCGEEAAARAQEALNLAERHEMRLEIAQGRLLLLAGQALAQADEMLPADILVDLQATYADTDDVQVSVICAQVALYSQDITLARRYLDPVYAQARQGTLPQPVIAEIYHYAPLRALIEHQSTAPATMGDNLKALDKAQLSSAQIDTLPHPTYSLRVYTFGQIQVERDGEAVTAWGSVRARDMFMYLLLCGPRSRDSICLHMWPDSSARQVQANFHISLRRAREALGHEVILYQDGLYLVNPAIDCWCDVQVFEGLIQSARIRPPITPQAEALWRKAAVLYQGDFLPEIDAEWADTQREALREMALDALVNLGRCLIAREDFKEALAPLRQALAIDPYREDVHRELMLCHAELGEFDGVVRQFRQLERRLRHDLAVPPSPETRALFTDLVSTGNPAPAY